MTPAVGARTNLGLAEGSGDLADTFGPSCRRSKYTPWAYDELERKLESETTRLRRQLDSTIVELELTRSKLREERQGAARMKLEVEAAKEEGGAAAERAQAEADARLAAQKAEVDAGRREPAQKAPPMRNAHSSIPPVKYKFPLSELPRALHRIAETRVNAPGPLRGHGPISPPGDMFCRLQAPGTAPASRAS